MPKPIMDVIDRAILKLQLSTIKMGIFTLKMTIYICPELSTNGRKFRTLTSVNCQSANIIYIITCKYCGIQYVGQTLERLTDHFQGHSRDIENNCVKPVGRHFNTCPLSSSETIQIEGFRYHSPQRSPMGVLELNLEERSWMYRLCSFTPNGRPRIKALNYL